MIIASIIFSPLVGYGFFLCSLNQAFKVAVDSRVAFFRLEAKSYPPPYLKYLTKLKLIISYIPQDITIYILCTPYSYTKYQMWIRRKSYLLIYFIVNDFPANSKTVIYSDIFLKCTKTVIPLFAKLH